MAVERDTFDAGSVQFPLAFFADPDGNALEIVGVAGAEPPGMVLVETAFGGRRVMDLLTGDPLPRIC